MQVNILPCARDLLPNPRLLELLRLRPRLHQSHIADNCNLFADQTHVLLAEGRLNLNFALRHPEVVLVEREAEDELRVRFGFETGHIFGHHGRVRHPVAGSDGAYQFTVQFKNFLVHPPSLLRQRNFFGTFVWRLAFFGCGRCRTEDLHEKSTHTIDPRPRGSFFRRLPDDRC
jgi:hypothetical protein